MDDIKRILDKIVGNNALFIVALVATGAMNLFFPFGILLLLYKIGVFKNVKRSTPKAQQNTRLVKYRIMTEGRSAESIAYLASAVGVSYETALRDLQQMVASGQFGPDAYINYVDKSLVLVPRGQPSGTQGAQSTQGASGTSSASQAAKAASQAASQAAKAASQAAKAVSQAAKTASQSAKTASQNAKTSSGASKKKTASKKQERPDEGLIKILLIAGIVLLGVGGISLLDCFDGGWYNPYGFIPGLLMVGGGVFSLLERGSLKKRNNRFQLYEVAVTGRDFVPLKELASKAGVSVKKVKRDLEAMLEKGLLPSTAYIDQGDGTLVLRPGASPHAEPEPEPPADDEDSYRAILREIRELNDAIPGEEVSARIDEMESLTARIFQAVQEKPEKLPQIKSFMSYYLPTTLKLLRTYADFERSGAEGENIRNVKAEIERILDTLVDGFRKQLDKLFEADAMDIASDIDVLENMLRRDGLAGDGSTFGGTASAKFTEGKNKKE